MLEGWTGFDYLVRAMTQPTDSILIVTKAGNEQAAALGEAISAWLEQRRTPSRTVANTESPDCLETGKARPGLVLVLGGDGTVLSVVRKLGQQQIPLIGLDLGRVGFLAELGRDDWQQGLERVLSGDFEIVERLALEFSVVRDTKVVTTGRVLNDLVVNRGALARLIQLEAWCDDNRLGAVRADGLVIFSPTGATAYAVSAGGPLVHPDLDVFGIAPICPFLSDFRPLILAGQSRVRIRVLEHPDTVYLTLDGQTGTTLLEGDDILVRKAGKSPLFVSLHKHSYVQRLRSKGYFKER